MRLNKLLLKILLCCFVCSMLLGCGSSKYIEPNRYMLTIKKPVIKYPKENYKCSVYVDSITAVSPSDDLDFIYRINKSQYIKDYYNGFLVSPSHQFDAITNYYLRSYGKFNTDVLPYTNTLKVSLLDMYADYQNSSDPKAVVSLSFLLTKFEHGKGTVLLDKTLTSKVTLQSKTTESLIEAWDVGIKNIFTTAIRDLNDKLICEI